MSWGLETHLLIIAMLTADWWVWPHSSDPLLLHVKENSHALEAISYPSGLQPLQWIRGVVQCYFCAVSRCWTAKPRNGVLRNASTYTLCRTGKFRNTFPFLLASVQKNDLLPRLLERRVLLITLMNQNQSVEHGFPMLCGGNFRSLFGTGIFQ